jgi:hypothetical protein
MIRSVAIGIDPGGSTGAISAIVTDKMDNKTVYLLEFKKATNQDISEFIRQFHGINNSLCVLEKVHAMPGNGAVAMFSFGENYGFLQGLLTAHKIPYIVVPPQQWQKKFKTTSIGTERFNSKLHVGATEAEVKSIKDAIKQRNAAKKKGHKDELLSIAQLKYPFIKITKGTADAVLISEYCRMYEL